MALRTRFVAGNDHYTVTVTFDDATGEIQTLQWVIDGTGSANVTVLQNGKQPLSTGLVSTNGSTQVPKGYLLTFDPKGDWTWSANGLSWSVDWSPA